MPERQRLRWDSLTLVPRRKGKRGGQQRHLRFMPPWQALPGRVWAGVHMGQQVPVQEDLPYHFSPGAAQLLQRFVDNLSKIMKFGQESKSSRAQKVPGDRRQVRGRRQQDRPAYPHGQAHVRSWYTRSFNTLWGTCPFVFFPLQVVSCALSPPRVAPPTLPFSSGMTMWQCAP